MSSPKPSGKSTRKPTAKKKQKVHKGWPKGKPRKIPGAGVHRVTTILGTLDLQNLEDIRRARPELAADADVVRFALEQTKGQLYPRPLEAEPTELGDEPTPEPV